MNLQAGEWESGRLCIVFHSLFNTVALYFQFSLGKMYQRATNKGLTEKNTVKQNTNVGFRLCGVRVESFVYLFLHESVCDYKIHKKQSLTQEQNYHCNWWIHIHRRSANKQTNKCIKSADGCKIYMYHVYLICSLIYKRLAHVQLAPFSVCICSDLCFNIAIESIAWISLDLYTNYGRLLLLVLLKTFVCTALLYHLWQICLDSLALFEAWLLHRLVYCSK